MYGKLRLNSTQNRNTDCDDSDNRVRKLKVLNILNIHLYNLLSIFKCLNFND